ncbi:MAG TPA: sortase [Firmicutes bacterium]|nr:sortase [Bacillota bacterium]
MIDKLLGAGGLLLIAAALLLSGGQLLESRQAAAASAQILQQMELSAPAERAPDSAAVAPDPAQEMPTEKVDGQNCIGVLEIPSLSLSLPVLSTWSDAGLRLAPCRYQGSASRGDLIIAAHNYRRHFGTLHRLCAGDAVFFTDAAGNRFAYAVSYTEQLAGTAVAEMAAGDWDLTLFTCTAGGKDRLAIRCKASC